MNRDEKKAEGSKASFEEELGRLEEIVSELESEGMTLEGALERFEEGTAIVRSAQKKLREGQLRVRKILGEEGGEPVMGDFLLSEGEERRGKGE